MSNKKIAVLPGDGIGPEVVKQTLRILDIIAKKHAIEYSFAEIGGSAYDKYGTHCPEETLKICANSQAILFGSVGGPVNASQLDKWKNCEVNSIIALRKNFNLSVNLRPIQLPTSLSSISPLKPSLIEQGVDIIIVRELVGDIYFGEHKRYQQQNKRCALDVCEYQEEQIAIAAHRACILAKNRNKKVTSVDKANVLDTSKLWREIVTEVASNYEDIQLEHMLVDNCAMQLVLNPSQFDVLVTGNLFGDILSDLASAIPGSLGLMPSASLNKQGFGLYEPSGGSAPDIAGKNIANPIGQILSLAMLLENSLGLVSEAMNIKKAIQQTLQEGYRTADIFTSGHKKVSTTEITDIIISFMN